MYHIATSASAAHQSGVNIALCDGSARSVSNSVSLSTWRAVGTMNVGDVLGNDW